MSLLSLPHELVERILLWLATESVQKCRLVNRELNTIIQSSTVLQYLQACAAAGIIDNPRSPLSYAERLEALKKREDAWRTLTPVFETTINVDHQASSVYDLTAGTYLLGDHNLRDLYYCRLPSSPQDNPRWIRIPCHGPEQNRSGIIIDMGMAVYEHDLIVNVICSEVGNQADIELYSLDLVLLKFSTGEYHPLARHPRIHVQRSPSTRPAIALEIVGDNLALVINSRHVCPDKLFIFDWKTGYKRLQHEAAENAYSGLFFVSPELLLVPNLILSHFEVWQIPPCHPNSKPPVQILSLQIPAVSRGYFLLTLSCRGEPSPFLHSIPYFPPRPFLPSPDNSIIIANLRLASFPGLRGASYTLVIHRRALLDTIQRWTSPSLLEQQEDLPTWLMNEVTVHNTANPDDGSVRLDAQSKLSSTSRYTFLQVPWAKWGPPISRWFQVNETQSQWISQSSGQRCAFLDPNPLDRRKLMVSVMDFNNFRRNAKMMARLRSGECDNNGSNGNKEKEEEEEEEFEILDHKGVFSEEVYMGLKCVIYRAPDEFDFDAIFMDEERLFGAKVSTWKWHRKSF
ncbi:hypothetical protein M378DRAFT_80273 [Amanita muscaria Koide BX008]|uniref:F-box domain-containing protein n=1 Tax=Amanita muscaria (strain Koide BX008) TaxID=946122 RepID=A0A0C2X1M0_AMAMK|nr:hypothetical protein M378DRAFT_80273 [Amanita muscaria Koide BX008]